jgi:hypothetical protein
MYSNLLITGLYIAIELIYITSILSLLEYRFEVSYSVFRFYLLSEGYLRHRSAIILLSAHDFFSVLRLFMPISCTLQFGRLCDVIYSMCTFPYIMWRIP